MRKMSPANEKEFEELSSFFCFYMAHVWHMPVDASVPVPVRGKVTKSQLLEGLRQAANDTAADDSLTAEAIAALDEACRANGVLTFSELRRRYSGQYRSVLKKQRISNDTEYYVMVGLVNDFSSPLSTEERSVLEGFVLAYEERAAKRSGS